MLSFKKIALISSILICVIFMFSTAINITSNSLTLTQEKLLDNHGFGGHFDHFRIYPPWLNFGPMRPTNVSWPNYLYSPNSTDTSMYSIIDDNTIEIVGEIPRYVGSRYGLTADTKVEVAKSPEYEGGTVINWDNPIYFGGKTRTRNFRIQGEIVDVDLDDPNYILKLKNYYHGFKQWDTNETPDPGASFISNFILPILGIPYSFYIKQINDDFYTKDRVVNIVPEDAMYITGPQSPTGQQIEDLVIFANDNIELNMVKTNSDITLNDVQWSVEDADLVELETLNNSSQILLRAKEDVGDTEVKINATLDSGIVVEASFTVFIIDVHVDNILTYAIDEPVFQNLNLDYTFTDLDYDALDMNIDYVAPYKNLFDFASYTISNFSNLFILELNPLAINEQNTLAELNSQYTNTSGIITQKDYNFHIMLFDPRPNVN